MRWAPSRVGSSSPFPADQDGVALLRLLLEVRPGPVTVAHLNHQLRGAESDADEDFVVSWRKRWTFLAVRPAATWPRRQVSSVITRKAPPDDCGTDWLGKVQEVGGTSILTGHTADDQAETVLHRLLRGTGLAGLRGIAARRPLTAVVEVVRPLLAVRRAELLAYLAALGQAAPAGQLQRRPAFHPQPDSPRVAAAAEPGLQPSDRGAAESVGWSGSRGPRRAGGRCPASC